MTHRKLPIIEWNCRINRLDYASEDCAGSDRDGRRSDFLMSMRLFTTFSISGVI